jgi:hypothetical protein
MTKHQIKQLQELKKHGLSNVKIAEELGVSRWTIDRHLTKAKGSDEAEILTFPSMPDGDISVEDILNHKRKIFKNKKQSNDFNKLINVTVRDDKPIGIVQIGDPHIDDDGCDIVQLEHDLEIIEKTKGMYAGHLGDLTNNWVGRLARLYANQSTTAKQAVMLMEWMLNRCPNLFVVNGNHDMWNQGSDIISFVMRSMPGINQSHGARIGLNFPNGNVIKINARHDFKGHSQYNPTHGHRKEQLWGGENDHIYVSGHRHIDASSLIPHKDGSCSWSFMVSGYKVIDDYAVEHGFHEQRLAPSVTTIINPKAKVEAEIVKPFWDIDEASDYLTYLRGRK